MRKFAVLFLLALAGPARSRNARNLFHRHRRRPVDADRFAVRAIPADGRRLYRFQRPRRRTGLPAAKIAHVKHIDYVLITHHHSDHEGGVPNLLERFPVGRFLDPGPTVETAPDQQRTYKAYRSRHGKDSIARTVKPGDTIPVKGLEVTVVTRRPETYRPSRRARASRIRSAKASRRRKTRSPKTRGRPA